MCIGDGDKQKNQQETNYFELIIKINGYGKLCKNDNLRAGAGT